MEDLLDSNTTHNKPLVQERLPNSGGIIAMGIISIVLAGLIGIILSIIVLSTTSRQVEAYRQDPSRYDESSYKQLNAGRICAIIGLCISGLAILIIIGAAAS